MPSLTYSSIDPRTIVIKRGTRQRQENITDIEDLKQSIATIGLINPIVVRREGDETVLVAGERRLTAALALGWQEIHVRYMESLSSQEAEIIELEENVKRKELGWKDQVRAIGRIHALYREQNAGWKIEQTAEAVSLTSAHLRKILHVYEALDSGRIDKAEGIEQAYNILHRFAERKAESIVGDIIVKGATIFGQAGEATAGEVTRLTPPPPSASDTLPPSSSTSLPNIPTSPPAAPPPIAAYVPPKDPVICANFLEWVKTYNGPKFTVIHCDFPYGNYRGADSKGSMSQLDSEDFYDNSEGVYWTLLEGLTQNLDRIMSYSAHLVFWFNMNFYTETVSRLRRAGLFVHDHPLIWHKTAGGGGLGVVPGTAVTYPRRTYDTALLAVRGNRPLAKPGMNSYAAPTVGNKIHPSQKPEPMLRHFLSMVVDETSTVLDPTCGSAAALRASEDLGAKYVLGLELDPNYAAAANTRTLQARVMRQAGSIHRDDLRSAE
jgi:ParB family chromosome partitioning protein